MKRLKLLRLLCFLVSRGFAFSAGKVSIDAFIRVLVRPDFCLRARKTRTLAYGLMALGFVLLLANLFWMSIESSVHLETNGPGIHAFLTNWLFS